MTDNHTTFYLVRHGKTEWNEKGLTQGHADSPLTAEALEDAGKLAKELKNVKFDVAFSSDLLRAKRTADIIAKEHQLLVDTTQALRERKFGHLEGQPGTLLAHMDEYIKSLAFDQRFKYRHGPDVESDEDIVSRVITFLREIAIAHPNKTVLLVTHGGVMRSLLVHLGLLTYEQPHHGTIKNLAYIKLKSDGIEFIIEETKGIVLPE